MQRMSAISTLTNKYVEKLKGLNCKILDKKTTPLNRFLEKEAVKIGGVTTTDLTLRYGYVKR